MIYLVEWTHGDGMDQHAEVADLSPIEADAVRSLLNELGAIEIHVYEPSATSTLSELLDMIHEDLGTAEEAAIG